MTRYWLVQYDEKDIHLIREEEDLVYVHANFFEEDCEENIRQVEIFIQTLGFLDSKKMLAELGMITVREITKEEYQVAVIRLELEAEIISDFGKDYLPSEDVN